MPGNGIAPPTKVLFPAIFVWFVTVALPAYLVVVLHKPEESRLKWLLKAAYTAAFVAYLFVAGRWEWVSYYLRYTLPVALVIVLIPTWRTMRSHPWQTDRQGRFWQQYAGELVTIAIFAALLVWALRGHVSLERAANIAFPLQDGWFYVAHGGNSALINHHNSNRPQRYALDIVALNAWGVRASGIYPQTLERYVVFDAPVTSPCDGTITSVVDGLPNLTPPATDGENLAGNHVVIACEGIEVMLAHLHPGSIAVERQQRVKRGLLLGRVGNSGNTSEPHLHIHAVRAGSGGPWNGVGVPLMFDGARAVRNSTF